MKSIKPKKQRKYIAVAPLHIKRKFLTARLSPELRKKHNIKRTPIRKGDSVRIMRGQFRGIEKKVDKIFTKKTKILIEDVKLQKADGTTSRYPIHPSNVMIIKIGSKDKKRFKKKEPKTKKTKSKGEKK